MLMSLWGSFGAKESEWLWLDSATAAAASTWGTFGFWYDSSRTLPLMGTAPAKPSSAHFGEQTRQNVWIMNWHRCTVYIHTAAAAAHFSLVIHVTLALSSTYRQRIVPLDFSPVLHSSSAKSLPQSPSLYATSAVPLRTELCGLSRC